MDKNKLKDIINYVADKQGLRFIIYHVKDKKPWRKDYFAHFVQEF